MRINSKGYIERKTVGRVGLTDLSTNYRDWWLANYNGISLNNIRIPKHLIGKRLRFKVEIVKDNTEEKMTYDYNKFEQYEKVRQSGMTNMFMVTNVIALSGLSRDEILDIMKNYSKYKEQYDKENKDFDEQIKDERNREYIQDYNESSIDEESFIDEDNIDKEE